MTGVQPSGVRHLVSLKTLVPFVRPPTRYEHYHKGVLFEGGKHILFGKICPMEVKVRLQPQPILLPVAHEKSVRALLCVCGSQKAHLKIFFCSHCSCRPQGPDCFYNDDE